MEIVGQGAGQRPDQIVAPVLPELYIENLDLEHVARFRTRDRNRTGEDVTGHHPLAFGMNFSEFGRHVKFAPVRHHVRAAADGIDGDFIAAGDGEDRLQLGFEKAPVAGFGAGMQVMMRHEGTFLSALP